MTVLTCLPSETEFPLPTPPRATKQGPHLPRAIADENALPNGQGAVVPHQQEVEELVCHPGVEKQP